MRPSQDEADSILAFLARFDAVFTLNQDLLLEIGYCQRVAPSFQTGTFRWTGLEFPGMVTRVPNPLSLTARWVGSRCPASRDVRSVAPVNSRTQPIYKLHGSSDWVDETGNRLLIMGEDKAGSIKGSKVLSLYASEFERRLSEPEARVMIIGYGFGDNHINVALNRAAAAGGLKAFIIDPVAGADAPDPDLGKVKLIGAASPLQPIQKALIGASRRPLSRTFGGDTIERDKVLRFFAP